MKTAKIFTGKVNFIEKSPVENAPFIVTNHTGISAPAMFLIHYKEKVRTWSHSAFLHCRSAITHLRKNVLKRRKYGFLLYPVALIFLPVIVWFFRSANPIPVMRGSKRIVETLESSVNCKQNGVTQVIFPEKLDGEDAELVNPYLYKLNRGFVYAAKYYYEKCGEKLRFYPAYSCPSLKTVVIGEPIIFNPEIPIILEKEIICRYLEDKIRSLAESLPPHKIVLPINK